METTAFTFNDTAMEESFDKENSKNPMLLSPVIRCIFKFLNIEDIKNCRLISHEWGSTGKLALANRAVIHLHKSESSLGRLPVDFRSCFLDSTTFFSAFKISGYLTKEYFSSSCWTIEELSNFFEEQQKFIKELTLKLQCLNENYANNIDIRSWISKSPIVQKDSKHLTKLVIEGYGKMLEVPPLHLIGHIKDITFSNCRINLEAGIQICSAKIKFSRATFFQDGIKLDSVRINDIMDLCGAIEVSLDCTNFESEEETTKYIVDFFGSITLDSLILQGVEVLNGATSEWVIEHLAITDIPYSLNSEMQIKEFFLSYSGSLDLSTLPNSIKKLALLNNAKGTVVSCSQPILWENLEYLYILDIPGPETDYSFHYHFINCPHLTHLKLNTFVEMEMNSLWLPKTVKTLTLEHTLISWLDKSYLNLEKLIFYGDFITAQKLCNSKIRVQDLVLQYEYGDLSVDEDLADFLEIRKRFSFGNRLYIGGLKWDEIQYEETVLKDYVNAESSFYVFENGEKGRAISEMEFYDLVPKHTDINR